MDLCSVLEGGGFRRPSLQSGLLSYREEHHASLSDIALPPYLSGVYGRSLTWPSQKGIFHHKAVPICQSAINGFILVLSRPMLPLGHGGTCSAQSSVMCPITYRPQRRLDQQHPPFFPAPVRRGDQRGIITNHSTSPGSHSGN
jgi:hypothetical protein